jgi:hypothetical protein
MAGGNSSPTGGGGPAAGWWRGTCPVADPREAGTIGLCPSTMLRMVPLPVPGRIGA